MVGKRHDQFDRRPCRRQPGGEVRLVEYFSYTCHVCADFAKLGAAPLKAQYVDRGLVLFEYRNLVRDPVDMTAALLARCGGHRLCAQPSGDFCRFRYLDGQGEGRHRCAGNSWYEGTPGSAPARSPPTPGLAH